MSVEIDRERHDSKPILRDFAKPLIKLGSMEQKLPGTLLIRAEMGVGALEKRNVHTKDKELALDKAREAVFKIAAAKAQGFDFRA